VLIGLAVGLTIFRIWGSAMAMVALPILALLAWSGVRLVRSGGAIGQTVGAVGLLVVIGIGSFFVGGAMTYLFAAGSVAWLAILGTVFAQQQIAGGRRSTKGFVALHLAAAVAMAVHIVFLLPVVVITLLSPPAATADLGSTLKWIAVLGWLSLLIAGCLAWRRMTLLVIGVPIASALLIWTVGIVGRDHVRWVLPIGPY
jgi:hypothetical protein